MSIDEFAEIQRIIDFARTAAATAYRRDDSMGTVDKLDEIADDLEKLIAEKPYGGQVNSSGFPIAPLANADMRRN